MADLEKIAEELSALTVIEASELSKLLEEKWGVSASAPVAMAAVAPGAAAGGGCDRVEYPDPNNASGLPSPAFESESRFNER